MAVCLFSWASMGMPTLSPTMATSCLILTCDLWYGEIFYYLACYCEMTVILFFWQYKEGKKLKPKPNYNSVDLSEVEWEDTEEKVSTKFSESAAQYNATRGGLSVWWLCYSWGQPWFKVKQEPCL